MNPRILAAVCYVFLLPLLVSAAVAKPDVALNKNASVVDLTKVEWSYQATALQQQATYESVMQLWTGRRR